MLADADGETADDVDGGDDQRGHGIAPDEFGGAVHGAEEIAFLVEFAAAPARDFFVDGAGVQVGVDRHLLAGDAVKGEACCDLRDAGGALGDDDEIHHQQNGEDDQADDDVAAHEEAAEGGDDMAGGERAFIAVGQNLAGGGDVQRQAEQGGEQKDGGEAGEIQRFDDEQRHHEDQDAGGEGEREADIQQKWRQRQDEHGEDEHHAEGEAHIRAYAQFAYAGQYFRE